MRIAQRFNAGNVAALCALSPVGMVEHPNAHSSVPTGLISPRTSVSQRSIAGLSSRCPSGTTAPPELSRTQPRPRARPTCRHADESVRDGDSDYPKEPEVLDGRAGEVD